VMQWTCASPKMVKRQTMLPRVDVGVPFLWRSRWAEIKENQEGFWLFKDGQPKKIVRPHASPHTLSSKIDIPEGSSYPSH
jgi:hypothetical protein